MTIKTNGYQSALDLAIMGYGSVEGLPLLIQDNPGKVISLTNWIRSGEEFEIKSEPINREVAELYRKKQMTAISKTTVNEGKRKNFNKDFNKDFM